jgi:3',5'-cyclic AMP phosphodiesterase CpdA
MKAIDALGLEGAEALAEIVRRYPRIERVLCGHVHRPIQIRWAGTVAVTAPATAHQFLLDLSPEAESRWGREPPAILLHVWEPDGGVVTHTAYVGDYGEPQPFH